MRDERLELPRFPTVAALCTTLFILLPLVRLLSAGRPWWV
jgi:hypothetical protein